MKLRNRRRNTEGFSLIEVMVAVAIFSITLLGFIFGLILVQRHSRSLTQRELAISKASEIMELFKNSTYSNIAYSTVGTPRYLRRKVDSTWNTNWKIPVVNTWEPLPVESVNGASATDPTLIVNKLPEGRWTVTITDITMGATPNWTFRRVQVRVQWKLLRGETRTQEVQMASDIYQNYTWL